MEAEAFSAGSLRHCLKREQILQCFLKADVQCWKNEVQMASSGVFQDPFLKNCKCWGYE